MKKKTKTLILSIVVTLILLLTFTVTYAVFTYQETGTNNQQLVLGDIYMHYQETDTTINIDNMMPLERYTLNTSEEAVNTCNEYLYQTYGDEWNGLVYSSLQPKNNKIEDNNLANFMDTKLIGYLAPSYASYCSGETLEIYQASEMSSNYSDVKAIPIVVEDKPIRTMQILKDFQNGGILTETDKKYFLENGIIIDNVANLDYFEFKISGKNTNTKGDISYNIKLLEGDEPVEEMSTDAVVSNRINPSFLRFRLTEVVGSEETILKDNQVFTSFENANLYTSIISKNTTSEINKTYRLYMWIDENVVIGNTEDADYSMDEWANLYASVKVQVNGKYTQAELLSEKVKSKLGSEGVVAVNTDGDLYDGTGEIREYRYSGIGNYCTYTNGENNYRLSVEGETCPQTACLLNGNFVVNGNSEAFIIEGESCTSMGGVELSLKDNQTTPTDSGLRNYVEFNGELWRIVGVFGDNVKIVKDAPLTNDIYTETTYTTGETTYELKFTTEGTKYGYFAYNNPIEGYQGTNLNDWTNSGVMHYLNDETGNSYYANNVSNAAKNMIEETTYYLGGVGNNMTTVADVYNDERDVNTVYSGNQATWTGKIALLNMSDFWYSTETNVWVEEYGSDFNGLRETWLGDSDSYSYWLLSPGAGDSQGVLVWDYNGLAGGSDADSRGALLPVLNLKSQVMTTGGDGSYSTPYTLIIE